MHRGVFSIPRPGPAGGARTILLLALALATPLLMAAGPGPRLTDGWIRVLTPQLPAAGYFVLNNPGDRPLELTGASSPACGYLLLHESITTNDTARMATVKRVTVPAHGRLVFQPGGYHLMCMPAASQLRPGESTPVSLRFKGGASLTAEFRVFGAKGR